MQTAEETIEIIKSIIQGIQPTQEEGRKLKEEIAKLRKEQEEYIASKNFKKAKDMDKAIYKKVRKLAYIERGLKNCQKLIEKALKNTSQKN